MYKFATEQYLPIDIQTAWNFFSAPQNLALITPPEMAFKLLTPLSDTDDIYEGMKIDYSIKPLIGIPLRWQSKIHNVVYLKYFTDTQAKGPYQYWAHTHTFTEVADGVIMKDVVDYKLPLGFIGKLAHATFVKRKIEAIFEYRQRTLDTLMTKTFKYHD